MSPQIQKTRPRAVAEGGVRRGRGVERPFQQPVYFLRAKMQEIKQKLADLESRIAKIMVRL